MTHEARGSHVPSALGSREGRARARSLWGKTEVGTKLTTGGQVSPDIVEHEKFVDGRVYFRARAVEPAVELGRNRNARSSFSVHIVFLDSEEDFRANADFFDVITRAATLAKQVALILALNLGRLL